ncbi:MAG: 30S ribosomal protein S3 [Chloroherpetonaceae bacterium]|nr:30S ribosomal protein S3 [Chloroherpetonaceae bacterium]MCS7212234.1 30S ribosomal protein S3 [Chloroherpetonaceae bacterium]MDW8018985.1 30S ribosomal protein S3 [Chloroherpetonaceae bacterium]MDW8464905.1 30S ribosomal protein S3 [Chloroherpetonaceae bacterium]
MGQKVNPIGFRLGIIKDWDSRWYDNSRSVADKIKEDYVIRNYVTTRLKRQKAGVSKVVIERTTKNIKLYIYAARPGAVVGKSGEEINTLSQELGKLTKKEVKIDVIEIKKPELDAQLVADNIAAQLEGRVAFRRAMKQAIQQAMRAGAEGVRVQVSGRLGGAEIARMEQYREGKVPLHTLRANIDYAQSTAFTITGTVGVKVWIYKGEVLGQRIEALEEEERQKVRDRRESARARGRQEQKQGKRRRRRRGGSKSTASQEGGSNQAPES